VALSGSSRNNPKGKIYMKLFGSAYILFLAALPLAADPISFVFVSSSTTGALVRASSDWSSIATIASVPNASGGLGKDLSGNYLVTTSSTLLRVTPTGTVSTIATAPSPTGWIGVAPDSLGNFIVVDNLQHAVWRISAAGNAIKVANYPVSDTSENEDASIIVDPSGNYRVLEDNSLTVQMFSITPAGGVTTIPLSGAVVTSAVGLVPDGAGNYLSAAYRDNSVFRVTPAGVITVLAHNGTQISSNVTGIARNPDNGDVILPTLAGSVLRVTANGSFVNTVAPSGPVLTNLQSVIAESYGALPHLTVGNVWTTGFFVVNIGDLPAQFSVSFYDDAGTSVAIPFPAPIGTVSAYQGTVPANGMTYVEASNPSAPGPVSAWGLISSDPNITIQALFRRQTDDTYYEAAVGPSAGSFAFTLPFDATTFAPTGAPLYTGFALANLDPVNSSTISCTAADQNGAVISNAVPLPIISPLGHYANYLFPALTGLSGSLSCKSNTKIGALALRAIGTSTISTLPVIVQ
jgi:hypothetical protein